jgi:hypothetical protein
MHQNVTCRVRQPWRAGTAKLEKIAETFSWHGLMASGRAAVHDPVGTMSPRLVFMPGHDGSGTPGSFFI